MDDLIKALLEERAAHAKFGRPRYVAAVDAELERLGFDTQPLRPSPPPPPPAPVVETAEAAKPVEDTAEPRPARRVEAAHQCDECPRSFRTAAALGAHRRSHRR